MSHEAPLPEFDPASLDGQTLDIPAYDAQEGDSVAMPEESRRDRLVRLAVALQRLGVSERETFKLLSEFELDQIERQLNWLPLRNPKKQASLIVTAIREDYEAPAGAIEPTPSPTLEDLINHLAD
ncbi:MAG: hypothetical protein ACYC96_10890 [Fimbriimonadaceae bacterium]